MSVCFIVMCHSDESNSSELVIVRVRVSHPIHVPAQMFLDITMNAEETNITYLQNFHLIKQSY